MGNFTSNARDLGLRQIVYDAYDTHALYTFRLKDYMIKTDGEDVCIFLGKKTKQHLGKLYEEKFGFFIDYTLMHFPMGNFQDLVKNYSHNNVCFKFFSTPEYAEFLTNLANREFAGKLNKIQEKTNQGRKDLLLRSEEHTSELQS